MGSMSIGNLAGLIPLDFDVWEGVWNLWLYALFSGPPDQRWWPDSLSRYPVGSFHLFLNSLSCYSNHFLHSSISYLGGPEIKHPTFIPSHSSCLYSKYFSLVWNTQKPF